jgi:hypothetical protein
MMETFVLPVRFGHFTSRDLSGDGRRLCSEVNRLFFGDITACQFLDIEWISKNFRINRRSFSNILKSAAHRINQGSNFYIDLGGYSFLDPVDPEIHYGLVEFLEDHSSKRLSKILIVCPGRLVRNSPEVSAVTKIAAMPHIFMVFTDGEDIDLGKSSAFESAGDLDTNAVVTIKMEAVRSAYVRFSDSTVRDFKKTIIRRPGWFRSAEAGLRYAFFYDFSQGGQHTLDLCLRQIRKISQEKIGYLYYLADRGWFAQAIEEAAVLSENDVRLVPIESGRLIEPSNKESYALFVPVVRSGKQFGHLLSDVTRMPARLWCLGSIDEGACVSVDDNSRKINFVRRDGHVAEIDLNYEVQVSVTGQGVGQMWSALDSRVEVSDFEQTKYSLSAPAMWAMMLEVGVTNEEYGAIDRNLISTVPRFKSMVENNASFLGGVFRAKILETLDKPLSENDLIVCVDEPAARLLTNEIVGSPYVRSILVSRSLLTALSATNNGDIDRRSRIIDEYREELENLKERVRYAKNVIGYTGTRAIRSIIIDESIISGKTICALQDVAKHIGLDVSGAFSIIDFSENEFQFDFAVRSIYRIPIPQNQWKSV